MILFQTPVWLTAFNVAIAFILFLVMLGAAALIVFSKRREDVTLIETKRADANAGLLKIRDTELGDCGKKVDKLEIEVEDLTAEHRTLIGIKLKELFDYWQKMESEKARMSDLESENRILRLRKDGDTRKPQ